MGETITLEDILPLSCIRLLVGEIMQDVLDKTIILQVVGR